MSVTQKVLVLLAHPALEKSRVNARMARTAKSVNGVTVRDLYETYPDFYINKAREQALVLEHQVIVMQHPLYWYSVPALLKEWVDIVLEHGFAYGGDGDGLSGRSLINVWSGGSPASDFAPRDGRDEVRALMHPFARTADYCGMRYLPSLTVSDTGAMSRGQIAAHCDRYCSLLNHLQQPDFVGQDFADHSTIETYLRSPGHG